MTSEPTWRNDGESLKCYICTKAIKKGEHMMDLFEPHEPSKTPKRRWVHNSCARSAIERWIEKKEATK